MSTEQNKAVVRRFITEVLTGRNVALADELLAPDYVNRSLNADLAGFKGYLATIKGAFSDLRLEIHELVAEGDAVVARYTMEGTITGSMMGVAPSGKKVSARGLTYYRLVNGKIVEDDPFSSPDLAQALGIPTPAAAMAGR
jgi:steroid delta-isomerase-like uncharacterized protein